MGRGVGWCMGLVFVVSAARAQTGASTAASAVSSTAAARVAAAHVESLGKAGEFVVAASRAVQDSETGALLAYCIDLQPQGYVIVGASTALPPVMAYSFTSDAGAVLGVENPLAALLGADLRRRLMYADLLPGELRVAQQAEWERCLEAGCAAVGDRHFEQWPPEGTTPTGGWLATNWTQDAPYNNFCPVDGGTGQHSLAGCPAVAMAQIVNYHARLNGTRLNDNDDYYHNYAGNRFWIDNDYAAHGFPSFPQLDGHLDALFDSYFHGTAPTNNGKAALVFACGVAAKQVYSASGSGTFGVSQAFDAFRRFGCDTAELLDANSPGLEQRLSDNMKIGKPAHLAVVDVNWSVGHNVVVDGYNTNGYFHLNFGWGGGYNGWYKLLSGLPYNLTVIEGLILDIMVQPCAPLDCTCDGRIDWQDYVYFAQCLSGPAGGTAAPGCTTFDADADTDVDMQDLAAFQAALG